MIYRFIDGRSCNEREMFCTSAKVSKSYDYDDSRSIAAGTGIVSVDKFRIGYGSLFLSDTGSDEFDTAKLRDLSGAVPSDYLCLCASL